MTNQKIIEELTRPIVGIENRTAQEAFEIMADRIRHRITAQEGLREALTECATCLQRFANRIGLPRPDGSARIGAIIERAEIQAVLQATNSARAALQAKEKVNGDI